MIRGLLRFLGLLMLALAFIFVIYDGMKTIADRTFYATSVSEFWINFHEQSLQAAQKSVENLSNALWTMAVGPILDQPAAAVFAVIGIVLIVLGRRKKPLIGYARD